MAADPRFQRFERFYTRASTSAAMAFVTALTGVGVYYLLLRLGLLILPSAAGGLLFGLATYAWPYAKIGFYEPFLGLCQVLALLWAMVYKTTPAVGDGLQDDPPGALARSGGLRGGLGHCSQAEPGAPAPGHRRVRGVGRVDGRQTRPRGTRAGRWAGPRTRSRPVGRGHALVQCGAYRRGDEPGIQPRELHAHAGHGPYPDRAFRQRILDGPRLLHLQSRRSAVSPWPAVDVACL